MEGTYIGTQGGRSRPFNAHSTSSPADIDPRSSNQIQRRLRALDPEELARLHTQVRHLIRGPSPLLRGLAAQKRIGGELRTECHVEHPTLRRGRHHLAWFRGLAVAPEQVASSHGVLPPVRRIPPREQALAWPDPLGSVELVSARSPPCRSAISLLLQPDSSTRRGSP